MTTCNSPDSDFAQLDCWIETLGVPSALVRLREKFETEKQFPQLFEVMKMQCRHSLGLPFIHDPIQESAHSDSSSQTSSSPAISDSQQRQLEDSLLDACQHVGLLILEEGNLELAWMYLQPVANRSLVQQRLESFPVDEELTDAMIDIAVSQGAAPVHGFKLLLKKYGTCNAITTFDMQSPRFDPTIQIGMAEILVEHLYQELLESIRNNWQNDSKSGKTGESCEADQIRSLSLAQLLDRCPTLTSNGHHLDATHLSSVVRIARIIRDRRHLQMALELVQYGKGLHPDFQYPCAPPFEETYIDHFLFFAAQLGLDQEAAVQHFTEKCNQIDENRFGGIAFETLADLLIRIGRRREAIELLIRSVWGKHVPSGLLPSMFQLAQNSEEYECLQTFFRERNDLLSYGIVCMQQESKSDFSPRTV